jgi:hypothetical protein
MTTVDPGGHSKVASVSPYVPSFSASLSLPLSLNLPPDLFLSAAIVAGAVREVLEV